MGTGNPDLQPYESVNLDLAYEYYYAEGSYFAVNYFRKDISDYRASLRSGPFNGVRDVTRGPRGALIVPENDDAYVNGQLVKVTGHADGQMYTTGHG